MTRLVRIELEIIAMAAKMAEAVTREQHDRSMRDIREDLSDVKERVVVIETKCNSHHTGG